jgi:hypothetical protein
MRKLFLSSGGTLSAVKAINNELGNRPHRIKPTTGFSEKIREFGIK